LESNKWFTKTQCYLHPIHYYHDNESEEREFIENAYKEGKECSFEVLKESSVFEYFGSCVHVLMKEEIMITRVLILQRSLTHHSKHESRYYDEVNECTGDTNNLGDPPPNVPILKNLLHLQPDRHTECLTTT
jgi:hypothetical protein